MQRIESRVDTHSETFARNQAHHRALEAELRAHLATARQGGSERARARHQERGALLARERIDLLLDPGSPFLELSPMAAHGMYGDDAPSSPTTPRSRAAPTTR
jgi:3-methylcrotonyl-CoA carboxylase beta subunit